MSIDSRQALLNKRDIDRTYDCLVLTKKEGLDSGIIKNMVSTAKESGDYTIVSGVLTKIDEEVSNYYKIISRFDTNLPNVITLLILICSTVFIDDLFSFLNVYLIKGLKVAFICLIIAVYLIRIWMIYRKMAKLKKHLNDIKNEIYNSL